MYQLFERIKIAARVVEASVTPARRSIVVQGRPVKLIRSLWWNTSSQENFDADIAPYLSAMVSRDASSILDVGAATGLFTIAACSLFPAARVYAFEPSRRQRILLRRNVRLNRLARRVGIHRECLWKSEGVLPFRTHGPLSTLRPVGTFSDEHFFLERVPTVTLDAWVARERLNRLDIVKMDVEGAEIEVLTGARETLRNFSPELLIQAYHVRNGARTFESCEAFLTTLGYHCSEISGTGLLVASKSQSGGGHDQ